MLFIDCCFNSASYSNLGILFCLPGLFDKEFHERLVKSLQLVLLFLPPSNRRVLHMLLKLLNKTSTNTDLVFDRDVPNKQLVSLECQDWSAMLELSSQY